MWDYYSQRTKKKKAVIELAARIVGGVIGIIFIIMVIGFISVFIELNF